MAIQLDHTIVPAHNRDESAKFLAELLGVPCEPAREGHQWEILTVSYARQN